MTAPILDISFLYELADNDNGYVYEVIKLFLDNVPGNLLKLEKAIKETNDYEIIQRHAHALKSSAGIIKIRGMYDGLAAIEALARQKSGRVEMIAKFDVLLANFNEALPLIEAEKEQKKPMRSSR